MQSAAMIARSLLAVAFLLSATAKAFDGESRNAATGLGVPRRFVPAVNLLLPIVELAAVVLLLPGATARVGLALSGLLLLAFTALLIANLARGQRPTCRCFGQLSDEPIGRATVGRNVLLLSLVGLGSTGGDPIGLVAWLGDRAPSTVAGAAITLAALLVVAVAYATRAPTGSPDDTAVTAAATLHEGDTAPGFTLTDLTGAPRHLDDLKAPDQLLLLVFSDPGCGPCGELVPQLERWRAHHGSHLSVVYLSSGTEDAIRAKVAETGIDPQNTLVLGGDFSVPDSYRFRGTPSAALIAPDGTIAGPIAAGTDEIAQLLVRADELRPVPTAPADLVVGDPVPPFHAHAIDDTHLDLASISGQLTLFVFWDPTCRFCGEFLERFRSLEDTIDTTRMHLVVVSSGDGGIAERSLPWPYVVDADRRLALGMGAAGSPMARLVDAEGRIASDLAQGADEIVTLVDRMALLSSVADGVGTQTS